MRRHDDNRERGETFKHLEDPLKLGPFTLVQWATLGVATFGSIVFGVYISPLPDNITIPSCIFVAGLPLALSYAVGGFDDLAVSATVSAVYRWVRAHKHYLPGPGTPSTCYRVTAPDTRDQPTARPADDLAAAARDLEGAWDQ